MAVVDRALSEVGDLRERVKSAESRSTELEVLLERFDSGGENPGDYVERVRVLEAENVDLRARIDRILVGFPAPWTEPEQGIVEWALPFDVTYEVLRDIVVVTIYAFALAANIAMWQVWQTRGRPATVAVEESRYGRPLLRDGEEVEVTG